MIRRFNLRDSLLIRRLAVGGICFDARAFLTDDLHLLRRAVSASLLPTILPETQIIDLDGHAIGFAQLNQRRGSPHSRIFYLSPREVTGSDLGSGLVENLLVEAGRHKAQFLLAETEEGTEEFGFLRREGFAIYARQEIWRIGTSGAPSASPPGGLLRPLTENDCPLILALYSSVVPALVQQAEGLTFPPSGWGLFEEGELAGSFFILSGPRGVWLDPCFHPGADNVSGWIDSLIGQVEPFAGRPIYFCVRSYQGWLGPILERMGFFLFAKQAVMARRIVVPVSVPQAAPLPVSETSLPNVTTIRLPISKRTDDTAKTNHR